MIRMPRESLDVLGSQNTGILCFLSVHPCNMTIRMKVSIQGRENRQREKKKVDFLKILIVGGPLTAINRIPSVTSSRPDGHRFCPLGRARVGSVVVTAIPFGLP